VPPLKHPSAPQTHGTNAKPVSPGPRFPSQPHPQPFRPEKPTAEDLLDLLLRIIVIVAILGLYTWWAGSTILTALGFLVGR
jgi:hypothetical protein